ncbi:MAG: hypothetical protein MJE68_01350 [Proteobacteria bacterium]|nr:hypothetical protein [Pseudomonadota bacterium]
MSFENRKLTNCRERERQRERGQREREGERTKRGEGEWKREIIDHSKFDLSCYNIVTCILQDSLDTCTCGVYMKGLHQIKV